MYNNLSTNLLTNHGGLSRNCLIESINKNSNNNDENNTDESLNLLKKSSYHDFDQFIRAIKSHPNTFNLISLNIQGVKTSFPELNVTMSKIKELKLNIGIICLQECHLRKMKWVLLI